jgi:hypothetical protein
MRLRLQNRALFTAFPSSCKRDCVPKGYLLLIGCPSLGWNSQPIILPSSQPFHAPLPETHDEVHPRESTYSIILAFTHSQGKPLSNYLRILFASMGSPPDEQQDGGLLPYAWSSITLITWHRRREMANRNSRSELPSMPGSLHPASRTDRGHCLP